MQAGVDVLDNFLDTFRTEDATSLLIRMKMCVYAAGTISPLVILLSTQWASVMVGRKHLLTVRHLFYLNT